MVAWLPVDLLATKKGRSQSIDLVGHPGHLAEAFDLEEYYLFQRAGLRLFSLSFSVWQKNLQGCVATVEGWLNEDQCIRKMRKLAGQRFTQLDCVPTTKMPPCCSLLPTPLYSRGRLLPA